MTCREVCLVRGVCCAFRFGFVSDFVTGVLLGVWFECLGLGS